MARQLTAWFKLDHNRKRRLNVISAGQAFRILGPHSCFGEIAVLDGLPRSATIRAVTESVVLRIPQGKFRELLDEDHLVAHKLIEHMALLLADRQRSGTEALSSLLQANDLVHVHEGIRQLIGESSIRE